MRKQFGAFSFSAACESDTCEAFQLSQHLRFFLSPFRHFGERTFLLLRIDFFKTLCRFHSRSVFSSSSVDDYGRAAHRRSDLRVQGGLQPLRQGRRWSRFSDLFSLSSFFFSIILHFISFFQIWLSVFLFFWCFLLDLGFRFKLR